MVKGEEAGDHLPGQDSRGEVEEGDLNFPLLLLRLRRLRRSENRGEVGVEDHHCRWSEQEAGEVRMGSSSPRRAAGRRIWCRSSSRARAGSGGTRVGSGEEAGGDHYLRRNWRCGCEPGSEADRGFWPICRRLREEVERGNGGVAAKARGAVGLDWDSGVWGVRLRRLCVLRGVARGVGRVCWCRMRSPCFGD